MDPQDPQWLYNPHQPFKYPLTFISTSCKSYTSPALRSPYSFEVYCPLSCKRVKIGLANNTRKEMQEFNTTSYRWVTATVDPDLTFLVNNYPPNKKEKKSISEPLGLHLEVHDNNNIAILNPYCTMLNNPLSLYSFAPRSSQPPPKPIEFHAQAPEEPKQWIGFSESKVYFHEDQRGTWLSHNWHFKDNLEGTVALVDPREKGKIAQMPPRAAKKAIQENLDYWLGQLDWIIQAEATGKANQGLAHNLDETYVQLGFYLNLDQQLRAKTMVAAGKNLAGQLFPYHPRLYSAFSRLSSLLNYGTTHYSSLLKLAEAGFYNRSDMLQDLSFYEHPTIPIPHAEEPQYRSVEELRTKNFPTSRLERGLPFPNVGLQTTVSALHPQLASRNKIAKKVVSGDYLLLVDEQGKVSFWVCKLMAVKLFELNLRKAVYKMQSWALVFEADEKQEVIGEDDKHISSLFDEPKNTEKVEAPKEVQADQGLLEQMISMGYPITASRKALIKVKNESIQAALDAIDSVLNEEKKKIKKKVKAQWMCQQCTFINSSFNQNCDMCSSSNEEILREEESPSEVEQIQQEQQNAQQELEKAKLAVEQQRLKKESQMEEERNKKAQLQLQQEKQQQEMHLVDVKFIRNEESPIDPFFVVALFHSKGSTHLKVFRYGLSRNYLARFYRFEATAVTSNFSRKIYDRTLPEISRLVREAGDLIEWGIRLFEAPNAQDWILTAFQTLSFPELYTSIQVTGLQLSLSKQDSNIHFSIITKDTLEAAAFELSSIDQIVAIPMPPQAIQPHIVANLEANTVQLGQELKVDETVSCIHIEVVESVPKGQWVQVDKPEGHFQAGKKEEVSMSDFLPLAVQSYDGSVFSGKYYSSSILEKNNMYISNYPTPHFALKSLDGSHMLVERVVVISPNKTLHKIYPVLQGLIFTANHLSYFHFAKNKFGTFTHADYVKWAASKPRNQRRQFWEPVASFQVDNEVEIELDFKRTAKYLFLLPVVLPLESKKEEVFAVKINFFGAKGRLEVYPSSEPLFHNFKHDGATSCSFTLTDTQGKSILEEDATVRRCSHVNSYHFLPISTEAYSTMPLSVTTVYEIKMKNSNFAKIIKVNSEFGKEARVVFRRQKIESAVEIGKVESYEQLARVQGSLNVFQISSILERLPAQNLLMLILKNEGKSSEYDQLLSRIEGISSFSASFFKAICEVFPRLCEESLPVSQLGLRRLLGCFEKYGSTKEEDSFGVVVSSIDHVVKYIAKHRNTSYNVLRNIHAIQDLVLEPHLFSKDYYKLVHPTYVDQKTKLVGGTEQFSNGVNNEMYLKQTSPFHYSAIVDLKEARSISSLKLFFPKITSAMNRQKLTLTIRSLSDEGTQQIYYRYFHEDFLMQMCVYAYKDTEMFSSVGLNCLVIPEVNAHARFLEITVHYLLLTQSASSKYKEPSPTESMVIHCLVDSSPSPTYIPTEAVQKKLKLQYPVSSTDLLIIEGMPPAKISKNGDVARYEVYNFSSGKEAVKTPFEDIINRLKTNIMERSIVDECIAAMKINSYEFNRKGIDFSYNFMLALMSTFKRYRVQKSLPVGLMLELFDTFIVYEIGPIMKRTLGFLQDCYMRLNQSEKEEFTERLITHYLQESVLDMKQCEKYSLNKIIDKLQQFPLPIAQLLRKLGESNSKLLRICLLKVLIFTISQRGVKAISQDSSDEAGTMQTALQCCFANALWMVDRTSSIKEQMISQAISLFLLPLKEQWSTKAQTMQAFMDQLDQVQLWRLIFLTLKLKSEVLKQQIHLVFGVLIEHLNERSKKSINEMLHQIITKQADCLYLQINPNLSEELWMSHLQTILQLLGMTKKDKEIFLEQSIAITLLQLPLTPTLWPLVLRIIPPNDETLTAVIRNFKPQYYSSLAKPLTKFCEPLAGIRELESIHINWLELVRKIRLEGKSLITLFVEQLQLTSFGGKEGLTMALQANVKNLQIACEFIKLILQSKAQLQMKDFSATTQRKLFLWYFLNRSKDKGVSPATEKVLLLSDQMRALFVRMAKIERLSIESISSFISIKRESEVVTSLFEKKRLPIHSALTLTRRFCDCFEELFKIFVTGESLSSHFVIEANGLNYLLSTIDIEPPATPPIEDVSVALPEEDFLVSEGLIPNKLSKETTTTSDIKELQDLKEEEFGTNLKLVEGMNPGLTVANIDWTLNKKGNKNKIMTLLLSPPNFNEYSFTVQLGKIVQIRSIKMGFVASSFELPDRLIVTPSSVLVEGGSTPTNFTPLGEMVDIADDGYLSMGAHLFVLNCQKLNSLSEIKEIVKEIEFSRVKYLRITIRRPLVTFLEGQYSLLNGKFYNNLACNLSFLSITGDDVEKFPFVLIDSCKEVTKKSSLNLLSEIMEKTNSLITHQIANEHSIAENIKKNFKRVKEYLRKYNKNMPSIVFAFGAANPILGDWILNAFLNEEDSGEIESGLVSQIILSTPKKILERIVMFHKSLMRKIARISTESEVEGGILYLRDMHFMESFCKTLQGCYSMGQEEETSFDTACEQVAAIIKVYDQRHSAPDIKSLIKILISIVYLRPPFRFSEQLLVQAMDAIWEQCSEQKPHFYYLMGTMLVSRSSKHWIVSDSYAKVDGLIEKIQKSAAENNQKTLKLQLSLLAQISLQEGQYLLKNKVPFELYNSLKNLTLAEVEIYELLLKIMQHTVLKCAEAVKQLATQLIEDVGLLVRRKDPLLQRLYVGLVSLEEQVVIHIKGLNLTETHHERHIPSKFLTTKQGFVLTGYIPRPCDYKLSAQICGKIEPEHQPIFTKAFQSASMLMLYRFRIKEALYTFGAYSSTPSVSDIDFISTSTNLIYEKGNFLFILKNQTLLPIKPPSTQKQLMGRVVIEDESQGTFVEFKDDKGVIFRFNFNETLGTPNIPILSLSNYSQQWEDFKNKLDENNEDYRFVGIQFWQATPKISLMSEKDKKKLSEKAQAKAPFSYYRHSPIYVFPANITIQKLLNLLGIEGVFSFKEKAVDKKVMLCELEKETQDFIIDMSIVSRQADEPAGEAGYIPLMRVFTEFKQMGGANEVIRLGSESIKLWSNADRKKNFENYMEELKSFMSLPKFLHLFVKENKYFTFLVEVAAGLPDDTTNKRDWEEEYVNSFRAIYKIVADIFKFDRSLELRDMDKYSDFCEVILEKLSLISKEKPRVLKEEDEDNQALEVAPVSVQRAKSDENKPKRKKKGTGYGADSQNNEKWLVSEWLENRKNVSQQILRVTTIIACFLECERPLEDERASEIIKQSCLLPLIQSSLRSSSLLDISKDPELFKTYLQLTKLLAANPATISCLGEIDRKYKPEQAESIYTLLQKLNGIASIFTECVKTEKDNASSSEVAEGISIQIQKTFKLVDKAVKNSKHKSKELSIKSLSALPLPIAYRQLLSDLRFGYVDLKEGATYRHAMASSITGSNSSAKILRLSQELADLSSSLPCESTNSIFVRCDKSRIDVITVLIMGSKDTPYSNGAFTFDVYCDSSYPNNPPKMLITTTGHGKIRFNPNLYSCGKVCLSLLGTWRGSASENWDSKVSTLLQLFISTQAITMSEDIYFNQPGFQGEQGTEEGEKKNQAYSNIVRLGNVRHAMVGQIKDPPKGFEEVIKRHFYIKRKEILEECEKWLEYAEKRPASYAGLVQDHNTNWANELKTTKTKYKELLEIEVKELRELLNNLAPPDLEMKEQSDQVFENQKGVANEMKELKLSEVDVGYDVSNGETKVYAESVMQDRWSRYIGAMGIEAVKKQAESSVLLIGLKPLGLEIAKNLVLSGLKKLTIVEEETMGDFSEHFFMSNMKGKEIKDCIFKIKELNPYMLVTFSPMVPDVSQYSLVISTTDLYSSTGLAQQCRLSGVKFIYAETKGACGNYFADFGSSFEINDANGEEPFEAVIKSISPDGVVLLLEGVKHSYEDGDYVVLNKVKGMEIVKEVAIDISAQQTFYEQLTKEKAVGVNGKVFKIKVINWNSFSIGDISCFGAYLSNGLVKNVKIPKKVEFKPMTECLKDFNASLDPNLGIYDFEKINDNFKVFVSFEALAEFRKLHKKAPSNWSIEDSKQFVRIVLLFLEERKVAEEDRAAILSFCRLFSFTCEAELPSIGAYLGGIIAQEAIKGITNKYTPIRQFFTFHFNELLPKLPESEEEIAKYAIPNEPFRNIKIVIGRENALKLEQMHVFVVGAGAIGCELLKNFAMINLAVGGELVVTDPDHIETSNLSRQFLFRQKHVKKSKSATACATLIQMNPALEGHISARLDKICQETEDIYSNAFFQTKGFVANALDNVRARQYVDKRCVQNRVALFESGTLGPKGHLQVIVPFKTENYGSQEDPNEEAQIPHCTLKMFPEETVHCIEWARDIFSKIFTLNPKSLKKVLQSKDISLVEGQERSVVSKMIDFRPKNFEDCIREAVRKFFVYFRNNVRQLMFTYPLDMKTKENRLFWQLPKRPPVQISKIDGKDDSHCIFIASYSVLLAKIYGLPFQTGFRTPEGKAKIMSIALKVPVEQFSPNTEASKELQKEVESEGKSETQTVKTEAQQMPPQHSEIKLTSELTAVKITPEEFQKDEDSNGHIDLIYSMSNLRAQNYSLNSCSWIEAKLKAGKIMAALSTTTSVVAALQTIQAIKLVTGCTVWRNAFINIAVPLIQISEPGPPTKYKIGNTEFDAWSEWEVKAATLSELIKKIEETYEVQTDNISSTDGKPVYWPAMYLNKEEAKTALLNKPLASMFSETTIYMNISLKNAKSGENYEKVPRMKVHIA